MAEECILLLILLVTEMPFAPDDMPEPHFPRAGEARVTRQLRRELVHRLAPGPCTHSELQDACNQMVPQSEALP
ncbi:unnamed protein product, partial [Discosporangium mesarthrocarpum]